MTRIGGPGSVAICVAVLLAALSLVAWRQSRAYEVLAALDQLRRESALAEAERAELQGRVRYLESRSRVVPAARDELGMHLPSSAEIVFLQRDEMEEVGIEVEGTPEEGS